MASQRLPTEDVDPGMEGREPATNMLKLDGSNSLQNLQLFGIQVASSRVCADARIE